MAVPTQNNVTTTNGGLPGATGLRHKLRRADGCRGGDDPLRDRRRAPHAAEVKAAIVDSACRVPGLGRQVGSGGIDDAAARRWTSSSSDADRHAEPLAARHAAAGSGPAPPDGGRLGLGPADTAAPTVSLARVADVSARGACARRSW